VVSYRCNKAPKEATIMFKREHFSVDDLGSGTVSARIDQSCSVADLAALFGWEPVRHEDRDGYCYWSGSFNGSLFSVFAAVPDEEDYDSEEEPAEKDRWYFAGGSAALAAISVNLKTEVL
jgi:hypothetical protein